MTRSVLLVLLIGAAGCATLDSDFPSVSVAARDGGAGEWRGVATGREMATTIGVMSEPVRLSIDETGRYTLSHRRGTGEIRSEGDVNVSGTRLTLDGHIVAPGMLTGAPVRHVIWRTEGGLVGAVDTFFLGHRVNPELLLAPQP